jgi:hypothetical protein
MRRHVCRVTNKTKLICALLLAGAAVSGACVVVSGWFDHGDTPAFARPVTPFVAPDPAGQAHVVVAGPDYVGYAYALGNLGVYDSVAQGQAFVDSLCKNLKVEGSSAGVVRGHLAGFQAPYDYDESTLIAIASDAKAFVCYR